jgi:LDH2 family malate/lactate/ureidoglycolate dehydrogenase
MITSSSTTIAVVHPITRRVFRHRGISPIAVGFPGQREPPIVIDMATSAEALGKVRMARWNGNRIPSGWAIDAKDGGATA